MLGTSTIQSGLSKVENAERKYELRARIQQLLNENEQSLPASSEPVSKKFSKVQINPRVGARSVLIDRPNQVAHQTLRFNGHLLAVRVIVAGRFQLSNEVKPFQRCHAVH